MTSSTTFVGLGRVNGREETLYAWRLSDPENETVGFLGIGFPMDHVQATRAQFREVGLTAGLLAFVGAVVLAWLLSRILIVPLGRITSAARSIARGEAQEIPQVGSRDELEDLGRSLTTPIAPPSCPVAGSP